MEVNIEADFETISNRFSERIEAAKKGAKISLTSPKIMKERYKSYFDEKNKDLPTFYTNNLSSELIARRIISLIKKA